MASTRASSAGRSADWAFARAWSSYNALVTEEKGKRGRVSFASFALPDLLGGPLSAPPPLSESPGPPQSSIDCLYAIDVQVENR